MAVQAQTQLHAVEVEYLRGLAQQREDEVLAIRSELDPHNLIYRFDLNMQNQNYTPILLLN